MLTTVKNQQLITKHPDLNLLGNLAAAETWSYLETLAQGLMAFAYQDKNFADIFNSLIKRQLAADRIESAPTSPYGLEISKPDSHLSARRRAEWLIDTLNQAKLPQATPVANTLGVWARQQTVPDPQNLIVGIVGLAIPGVTLGLIKKSVSVRIILPRANAKIAPLAMSKLVSRVSLGLLEQSLQVVGDDPAQLEPETSDWFYGGKEVAFYTTGLTNLTKITNELTAHNIPHSLDQTDNAQVLAISPSINHLYAWYAWDMQPVAA